jgi:hypothetical protein
MYLEPTNLHRCSQSHHSPIQAPVMVKLLALILKVIYLCLYNYHMLNMRIPYCSITGFTRQRLLATFNSIRKKEGLNALGQWWVVRSHPSWCDLPYTFSHSVMVKGSLKYSKHAVTPTTMLIASYYSAMNTVSPTGFLWDGSASATYLPNGISLTNCVTRYVLCAAPGADRFPQTIPTCSDDISPLYNIISVDGLRVIIGIRQADRFPLTIPTSIRFVLSYKIVSANRFLGFIGTRQLTALSALDKIVRLQSVTGG